MAKRTKLKLGDVVTECYRIGEIADAIDRGVPSVRRYEKLGAIEALFICQIQHPDIG